MPWVTLLEIAGTVLLAAMGVAAAVHRWLMRIDARMDTMCVRMDTLAEEVKSLGAAQVSHDRRLRRVSDVVLVELAKNDGNSMKDKLERLEILVKLLNPEQPE